MKMFGKDLKEQAMKIINYEKKEVIPLTDKRQLCKDENNKKQFKKTQNVRYNCHYTGKYRGAAHGICNLGYTTPKMIPIVFHNGSKCDYHFIIRELAREFKYYLECLGENTEKYITFSVPIKKVLDKDKKDDNDSDNDKNEKNGKDKKKDKDKKNIIITCRLRFFDSCRFMQDSLLNLVDNLSGINNKLSEIDNKILKAALIEKFSETYQLCNNELNKFALFLRKGVYPYEHMDI